MTKYRVNDRPQRVDYLVERREPTYFEVGTVVEAVDADASKTDVDGEVFVRGVTLTGNVFGYILPSALDPIEEDAPADEISQMGQEQGVTGFVPTRTEPVRVWSEHLADITRAVQIISDADEALNSATPQGTPGAWSDLEFGLPRRVPISLGGIDTGWAIVWDEDSEAWMAEFGA